MTSSRCWTMINEAYPGHRRCRTAGPLCCQPTRGRLRGNSTRSHRAFDRCRVRRHRYLNRSELAPAIHGHDAVLHLVAHDADANASETDFIRTNVEGTWNVFDLARAASVARFVHCSSVAALNISLENPPRHLPVDVTHTAAPREAYELSTLMGEAIARRFAALGDMSVISLRPTLVMYD